jgi:hypothetical protein
MINTCIRSHDNIGWDGWRNGHVYACISIGGKGYSRVLYFRAQAFEVGFREIYDLHR